MCGVCQCNGTYRGQFCEHIPGGTSALCKFFDACVEATILKKLEKPNDTTKCVTENNQTHSIRFVEELPSDSCYMRIRYNHDTFCEYNYMYQLDKSNHATLTIQDQTCPPTSYAMLGFISALIATVVIGLLTLCIWYICVTIKDKREYARFELEQKEKTRYSMQMSPIYKSPITEYKVPQFTFSSREKL